MKRTIVLLSLSVLTAGQSGAQNTSESPVAPQYRHAIKVYNTLSYQKSQVFGLPAGPPSSVTNSKQLDFLNPSVAFMWTDKKGHTREVELSSFSIRNRKDMTTMGTTTIMGRMVTSYDIALRLEHIFLFAKKKNWKLKPALGVGVSPYFNMEKVAPYVTSIMPYIYTRWGVKAYFTPRINYNVSERFFIDLNIPVTLGDLGMVHQKNFVPAIGTEMTYATGNFNAGSESPSLRLGVGLRL